MQEAAARRHRHPLGPAVALGLLAWVVAGCQVTEAVTVLDELVEQSKRREFATADLAQVRRPIAYRVGGRARVADLYERVEDGRRPHAAVVLVPGLSPQGKDDPRLVALALALAKGRFAVLVPDMPNLREARVGIEDIRAIADAVHQLEAMRYRPIGVQAVSYAVGPALLAAMEPDIRDRVGFLLAIGGYYDGEAVIRYFTTGYYQPAPGLPAIVGRPDPAAKWRFAQSNAAYIADPADRAALSAIAIAKHADPGRDVGAMARRLKAEGRAVVALVENTDPARVPDLIRRLPPRIRDTLDALNPARRNLRDDMRARLILVHGEDDRVIPAAESGRLAQAVRRGRADLYLVERLFHADLAAPSWHDRIVLLCATVRVLDQRDP
ncbi:MAG TPA: alpha/beta hydrolase [Alphaproteobacteria bacterium]